MPYPPDVPFIFKVPLLTFNIVSLKPKATPAEKILFPELEPFIEAFPDMLISVLLLPFPPKATPNPYSPDIVPFIYESKAEIFTFGPKITPALYPSAAVPPFVELTEPFILTVPLLAFSITLFKRTPASSG
ncbi:hypothetical protein [Escherichia coli]|uniref:hypothetical protein n=2 Tax=Escherichia coli TaxID=562 RepID=UPI0012FF636F|nr:hypothetical protein [Escherichia coli]